MVMSVGPGADDLHFLAGGGGKLPIQAQSPHDPQVQPMDEPGSLYFNLYWGADRTPACLGQGFDRMPSRRDSGPRKVRQEETATPLALRGGGGFEAHQTRSRQDM